MIKRGQVSLFAIIAIVVLILVGLGLYFRNDIRDFLYEQQILSSAAVPQEVESVNSFVLDCVRQASEESLSFVGAYGGYYDVTKRANKNDRGIPYYLMGDKLLVPSKKIIEQSLAAYVNENLKLCTNGFSEFNNSFRVVQGSVTSKVTINPGKVNFNVKYPLKLTKGANQYDLKFFNSDVDNNLDKVYNATVVLFNQQANYKDLCLTCVYNVATVNNLTIEVYNPEYGEVEYTFVDDNLKILGNQSFNFVIAARLG